ncbi:hypothetical protein K2X92_04630 [Candidatus Gracilibacteria bacterium]|nr:hypothetical protein [Candidatus Gracilibacteria bacterium]
MEKRKSLSVVVIILFLLIGGFVLIQMNYPGLSDMSNKLPNPSASGGNSPGIKPLSQLGDSTTKVIDEFYDPSNKEMIDAWVSNTENWATSSRGDIIEFLSYCERIKLLDKSKEKNLKVFEDIDLIDIKELIKSNTELQVYAKNNQNLSKKGYAYSGTSYSTELIRSFYAKNPSILSADPSPYAVNEIYGFLKGEISDSDFYVIMDKVIAFNHQGSKLYSGFYKEYYMTTGKIVCSDILRKYGKGEEKFKYE